MSYHFATKEDIDSLAVLASTRIENCSESKESLLEALDNPNFLLLICKEEETLIGFILLRLSLEEADIDDICVRKEEEGKGYGSALLEKSFALLKERGIQKVFLEVRKDNLKAIRCYERNDFTCYRERKNYYPGCSALCYVKEI